MRASTFVGVVLVAAPLAGVAGAQDAAPSKDEKAKSELREEADRLADAKAYPMPGEIVVSARRGVPLTYAGGRDVIERDVLERYPEASVSSIVRRVPGVSVLPENGNDGKVNIGLRGNSPRRSGLTMLLVDGVPSAEAPYGSTDSDYLPFAFERLQKIDVIRGGGAIRYGMNSAFGVINFITEPVPDHDLARFVARYGSDGDYAVGTIVGGTWDKFGTLVSIVRKGGDGYRDNGDYAIDDASMKFKFDFNDRDTLTASISRYLELDAKLPGGLSPPAYDSDTSQSQRQGQDFRGDINTWTAEFIHKIDEKTSFQLLGWYHSGQRELYGFRPNPPPFTQRTAQHSVFRAGAIEARYAWETQIGGVTNSFFHSARYLDEQNYLFYYRNNLPNGPAVFPYVLNADFETQAMSMFNEDVVHLTDTLDLGLGARMEVISMGSAARDTTTVRDSDYHEFLPVTTLTWSVQPKTALYASWQKSFYVPQYETGFDPTSSYYNAVTPEHSKTTEIGARVREIAGLEFAAAAFETNYEDKIEFVNQPNGSKLTFNVGEQRTRGLELSASVDAGKLAPDLAGFSAFVTLTKMKAIIGSGVNEGNDAAEVPRTLSSWGVQYDHSTGLWARIGGSHSGASFHEPENYTQTDASGLQGINPAFTLWDAAIGWRERRDGEGFSVQVGVTNLFEEEYFRRFTGGMYPGAPRQLFVSGSYTLSW